MNEKIAIEKVIEIAEEAGAVLLKLQKDVKEIPQNRKDFLTDADLKSNDLITLRLRSLDPDIPIHSEENDQPLISKGRIWVVDPLDGTINFFHQDCLWGVSIALAENGKTILGAVCLPALSQAFGATSDGQLIARGEASLGIRKESRLSEALVWADWGGELGATSLLLKKIRSMSLALEGRGCATASLMAVATGKICAYIHPHPTPEDFSASGLIVEKAGGKGTDLQGKPWDIFSKSIVFSNGILHESIMKGIG